MLQLSWFLNYKMVKRKTENDNSSEMKTEYPIKSYGCHMQFSLHERIIK